MSTRVKVIRSLDWNQALASYPYQAAQRIGACCCVLLALLLQAASLGAQASPDSQNGGSQRVSVVGRGATLYEAREDAIRQAMQIAVRQLVLANRVVQNDQIITEQVASTMNGYINAFVVKKVSSNDGQTEMEADVEVSESRLIPFIGAKAESKGDAQTALADAQRELMARRARAEVLLRLLNPFPSGALVASKPTIKVSESDPRLLEIALQAGVSSQFLRSFRSGLIALGAKPGAASRAPDTLSVCFLDFDPASTSQILARDILPAAVRQMTAGTAKSEPDCLVISALDLKLLDSLDWRRVPPPNNGVLDFIVAMRTSAGGARLVQSNVRSLPAVLFAQAYDPTANNTVINISQQEHTIRALVAARDVEEAADHGLVVVPILAGHRTTSGYLGVLWSMAPPDVETLTQPLLEDLVRSVGVPVPSSARRAMEVSGSCSGEQSAWLKSTTYPRLQDGAGHLLSDGDSSRTAIDSDRNRRMTTARGTDLINLVEEEFKERAKTALGGIGSEKIQRMRAAALAGDCMAQYYLGQAYDFNSPTNNFDDLAPDFAMAAQWYLKAAQQGHAGAQDSLADLYARGDGVEANEGKALEWRLKAAASGSWSARVGLGLTCGQEPKLSSEQKMDALSWLLIVIAKGAVPQDAKGVYDECVKLWNVGLPSSQVNEAVRRAQNWVAKYDQQPKR